jgi:hypothetical protein
MSRGSPARRLIGPGLAAALALALAAPAAAQTDPYQPSPPPGYCPNPDYVPGGGGDQYIPCPPPNPGPGPSTGGGGGGGGGGSSSRMCLDSVGKVGGKGAGSVRLEDTPEEAIARAGVAPRKQTVDAMRFCVKGGGQIGIAFRSGRVAAIAARAQGYELKGLTLGDSKEMLSKASKRKPKKVNRSLYLLSKGVVGLRRGFVEYLGTATKELLERKNALEKLMERAAET